MLGTPSFKGSKAFVTSDLWFGPAGCAGGTHELHREGGVWRVVGQVGTQWMA
jgi:hypothetical protein